MSRVPCAARAGTAERPVGHGERLILVTLTGPTRRRVAGALRRSGRHR